jgi:hypothetical protein
MSTIAQGDAEREGFTYHWMVNRNSGGACTAVVTAGHTSVAHPLAVQPDSEETAKALCNELLPELIKRLKTHGAQPSCTGT